MRITYHGFSCFKIVAKPSGRGSDDVTVVFAPFDKNTGLRPLQSKTDLVFVPHKSSEYNNIDSLRGEPIVLDMPGEYAVKGINVVSTDAPADPRGGEERGNTVVTVMDIEDMKIAYLGALGGELTPDQVDTMVGADVLFLPIGDNDGLDGKTAEVIARKIEPKIIIPMQFAAKSQKTTHLRDASDFCSNIGNCPKEQIDKFVVKANDIENKLMEVVFLNIV